MNKKTLETFKAENVLKSMRTYMHVILLASLFLPMPTLSQSLKSVRINEVQIVNTDGFRDEYGQAIGWFELCNKGYGKVNIAGCLLKVKGKEYLIPRGDPATVIATQGYVVFFASNIPDRGTFHTNFTLDDTDFIEFCDPDGNTIDRFQFNPDEIVGNVSYGWSDDSEGIEHWVQLQATTPGGSNNTEVREPRSEYIQREDPTGLVLTLICVLFISITMTLLYFIFKFMGNFYIRSAAKKSKKKTSTVSGDKTGTDKVKNRVITNDELAVIAIALYKYAQELKDKEVMTLTINRVSKAYSPWSSKIYGLRHFPEKK